MGYGTLTRLVPISLLVIFASVGCAGPSADMIQTCTIGPSSAPAAPASVGATSVSVDNEEPASEVAPRHVIVITLDTTRADHFGFLGNQQVETPYFDALAKESVVLTDFMTVAPTTLASHTSLFTGKHPHHHGTPRNGFMVNRANGMLAEVLHRQGFHTAGFVGSFALDSRFDFAQGFDHYDEDLYVHVGDGGADQDQRSSTMVTDAVIRYLNQSDIPEHLFLFAHYFDPHQPYTAPGRFTERFDSEDAATLWSVDDVRGTWFTNWFRQGAKQHHAQRHALRYAAEVSYLELRGWASAGDTTRPRHPRRRDPGHRERPWRDVPRA